MTAAEREFYNAWGKQEDKDVDDPEVEKLYETYGATQLAGFAEVAAIAKADLDLPPAAAFDGLNWLLKTPQSARLPDLPIALAMLHRPSCDESAAFGPGIAVLAY